MQKGPFNCAAVKNRLIKTVFKRTMITLAIFHNTLPMAFEDLNTTYTSTNITI